MARLGSDLEDSLERALQLRDRLRDSTFVEGAHLRRCVRSQVYCGDDQSDAVPDAVDQLLGACSACNLHTAIALVSKMKAMGINASCNKLIMQPSLALQRRKQQQSQQQIAFGSWGRNVGSSCAAACQEGTKLVTTAGWGCLTPDILLKVSELLEDRDILAAACACAAWRDVLNLGIKRMSFSWTTRCMRAGHVNGVVGGAALLFQQLEVVSLRRVAELRDDALASLAFSCGHHLQEVDLSGCQCITDTGIQALARSCPHLRSVNVSSCYELTDEALCAMAACHRLRAVNTCGCERLTDQGLCSLANGARGLLELNLGWCEGITEVGLQALAQHCHSLRVLDLCGCIKVRDMGMIAVAESCRQLTALGLHCCRRLTDASMAAIAFNLSRLVRLNVSGCLPMSSKAVQAVVDANPGLHTCCSFQRTLIIGGCLALLGVSCKCKRHP